MYESSLKLAFSNANQIDQEYISQKPDGVAKDIYIETYVPNRTAQIALSNYTVMKAIIPGDSSITAGRTVNILLYSLGMEGTIKWIDSLGTLHVKWDNGRTLNLLPNEDEFEFIN